MGLGQNLNLLIYVFSPSQSELVIVIQFDSPIPKAAVSASAHVNEGFNGGCVTPALKPTTGDQHKAL